MIVRRLSLAFGLLAGVAASQAPEYEQQYRQRLGGAIDELSQIVLRFEQDAKAAGESFSQGVAHLRASSDEFVRQRGTQMEDIAARKQKLEAQQQALASGNALTRLWGLAEGLDPAVANGAWKAYEPAVPTSMEGVGAALLGLLVGTGLFRLSAVPFRRRVRPGMART